MTRTAAALRLRYLGAVCLRVFWYGDTVPIRVLMAVASLVFAALVLAYPDTFQRRAFVGMGTVVTQFEIGRAIGPGVVWAFLFGLHGVGVFWRIVEARQRIAWAVAINWLGWFVWSTEIVLTSVSLGEFPAGNALALPALLALSVALVRTGLNDEKVSA